jgi:surface antigen
MFKQGLVLAISTFLIATAAARPGVSFQEGGCPSAPAQLKPGDIAVVTISDANNLNLRLQPGLNQEIITGIPKDASITIVAGPVCKDGFRWYQVDYQGQAGWSVEVGPEGLYSLFPVGTSIIDRQNNQSADPNPPVEASQPQPSMLQELGCTIWSYFCPQEVNIRSWEFQQYQCTWYAAEKRPDVYNWMPIYGVNARDWANIAVQNQIPVSSANDLDFKLDFDHVRPGDLVVLQPGCAGADANYGHVAYVESVDYTYGIIHVSEYNARYESNYDEQDLYVYWCMSFIH